MSFCFFLLAVFCFQHTSNIKIVISIHLCWWHEYCIISCFNVWILWICKFQPNLSYDFLLICCLLLIALDINRLYGVGFMCANECHFHESTRNDEPKADAINKKIMHRHDTKLHESKIATVRITFFSCTIIHWRDNCYSSSFCCIFFIYKFVSLYLVEATSFAYIHCVCVCSLMWWDFFPEILFCLHIFCSKHLNCFVAFLNLYENVQTFLACVVLSRDLLGQSRHFDLHARDRPLLLQAAPHPHRKCDMVVVCLCVFVPMYVCVCVCG